MSGFASRSSRALVVLGVAGFASTLALSNASAFGGRGGGMHVMGGGGMHSMGGMHVMGGGMRSSWGMHPSMGGMPHFPVSTPSWMSGGTHPTGGNNCGYGGGCGGVWGSHTTQAKLPPLWGSHTPSQPWHPASQTWPQGGGQTASHCGWWAGCGGSGRPWGPNRPWFPGRPWHPGYPVVYNTPAITPIYTTPTYTAPSYTAPTYTAPTYTAPVTYTTPAPTYTAPATYTAPSTPAYTAPATYTPAPVASTCPADANPEYVLVTFQSNASAVDTASFLKAYNVVVQDGPSQDGSFKLRLQTSLPQDQLSQMIDSMKAQSTIVSQATAG